MTSYFFRVIFFFFFNSSWVVCSTFLVCFYFRTSLSNHGQQCLISFFWAFFFCIFFHSNPKNSSCHLVFFFLPTNAQWQKIIWCVVSFFRIFYIFLSSCFTHFKSNFIQHAEAWFWSWSHKSMLCRLDFPELWENAEDRYPGSLDRWTPGTLKMDWTEIETNGLGEKFS